MENWTEVKTAYLLGSLGTVSATAKTFGVHRATVIRRVESLESQLGGKLFQRHSKGYTPTELGRELIRIAEQSDDSFRQLIVKARTQDENLAGKLAVSCPEVINYVAFAAARTFKKANPKVLLHFRSSNEVLKLEHGEADVAISMGDPPSHPDYIVRRLLDMPIGLYCSTLNGYATKYGCDDACAYRGPFVVSEQNAFGDEIGRWIDDNVDAEQFLLTSSIRSANDAVVSGLGAGFLPRDLARCIPLLTEILPSATSWNVPVWVTTHVDLHRSAKVQSFLKYVNTASRPDSSRGSCVRPSKSQGARSSDGGPTLRRSPRVVAP